MNLLFFALIALSLSSALSKRPKQLTIKAVRSSNTLSAPSSSNALPAVGSPYTMQLNVTNIKHGTGSLNGLIVNHVLDPATGKLLIVGQAVIIFELPKGQIHVSIVYKRKLSAPRLLHQMAVIGATGVYENVFSGGTFEMPDNTWTIWRLTYRE